MLETNFQAAVTQQHRILPIDGVINFRDLGGYQTDDGGTVRFGRVFRSAQLSGLTPLGSQQVASLAIESVADLRFDEEINLFPSVKSAFPKAEFVSWQDLQVEVNRTNVKQEKATLGKGSWRDSLDSHDPDQVREAMRLNYPQKLYSHQYIYKDMLLRLMHKKSPLLFHCAAGKDRTGVAAALILSLIGVNEEQIIKDYLIV
jgi:protein-tyrosine phosphatase